MKLRISTTKVVGAVVAGALLATNGATAFAAAPDSAPKTSPQVGTFHASVPLGALGGSGLSPQNDFGNGNKSLTQAINKLIPCTGSVTSAKVTGSVTLTGTADLSWTTAWRTYTIIPTPYVRSVSADVSFTESASLQASLAAAASCNKTIQLVTVPIPLGTSGFTVNLGLGVDAIASAQGAVSVSGGEQGHLSAGVSYYNPTGRPKDGTTSSHHDAGLTWNVGTPQVSGSTKFEVGVDASVGVMIAGLLGPAVTARGYVGVQGDSTKTPAWRLYDGVKITGALDFDVPGFPPLHFGQITIYQQEWPIAAFGGGVLWHTIRNADGSWTPAGNASSVAGIPGSVTDATAASSGPGVVQYAAVTSDGRLWHSVRGADGSWTPAGDMAAAAGIPGPVVSVAAASSSPGVVQFLVATADGRLWHTIRNADGTWVPAGDAGAAAGIAGSAVSVAAASPSPGVVQFLVATSDGRLWHTIRNADGTWTPAGNAGGAMGLPGSAQSVAAAASGPGVVQFLVVTSDGRLWHSIRNADGTWTPAGDAAGIAQLPGTVHAAAAASSAPGVAQFLITTTDGHVWHTIRNADGTWQRAGDAESAAGVTGSGAAVAAASPAAGVVQFLMTA